MCLLQIRVLQGMGLSQNRGLQGMGLLQNKGLPGIGLSQNKVYMVRVYRKIGFSDSVCRFKHFANLNNSATVFDYMTNLKNVC